MRTRLDLLLALPLPLLLLQPLAARPAAAQPETVVASAEGRDAGCSVGTWRMAAPEFVAPGEAFVVRFSGQATSMPESITVTLRGPSGVARRVASYAPDERARPICDSVGPVACAPYGTGPADFHVVFEPATVDAPGEHRLEAGPPGARATCGLTLRVSAPLAGVQRAHLPAHGSALFVQGGHRVRTWQLVRAPLGHRRVHRRAHAFARAVFGEPGHEDVVDLSEPIDEAELAAYLRSLPRATFDDVVAATSAPSSEAPDAPSPREPRVDPRSPLPPGASALQLLPAVFHEERLVSFEVSADHFELAWRVSATRRPSGRTLVRIRGGVLDRATLELAAAYLAALHPSLPPALP